MANLDVYQIVDKSLFQGQECLNVYFYQARNVLGAPTALDMSDAYIGQLLPAVLDIQNADLLHTEIRVQNLFDPADVHVEAISEPGVGGAGDDLMPIFNSIAFRLVGDNGAVRNGAKRYAGLTEGQFTDGVVTGAGYIAVLDDLADLLFDTLLFGVIEQFVPVIVKRILVGSDYVLPSSLVEATLSSVIDAIWTPLATSQVSRKIGSGS